MKSTQINKALMYLMIAFWSLWFFISSLTNMCDFLLYQGIIPSGFVFHSGNLALVKSIITPFGLGETAASIFIVLVAFVQLIIADCFFMSIMADRISLEKFKLWLSLAFFLSIGLWIVFLLLSELFVYYSINHKYLILIIAELLMWAWIDKTAASIRRLPKPRTNT